jgi:hypothetical protein
MVMVEVPDWRNFLMGFLKKAAVVRLLLFEKCGDEAGICVPARARASESGVRQSFPVFCVGRIKMLSPLKRQSSMTHEWGAHLSTSAVWTSRTYSVLVRSTSNIFATSSIFKSRY